MSQLNRDIRYTNKDFDDFREALINYSKTYFPDSYNDFTDESIGMLFIEMASYVGDVLSFYLDNQIQETFIQHARQTENIFNLAYFLGYTPKISSVAHTEIDIYQQIPSKIDGTPDYDYCLYIPTNTSVTSTAGLNFLIENSVDFSFSSSYDPTEVSILTVDEETSVPEYYLLKKTRKAISSTIKEIEFSFTEPEKFITQNISDTNIIKILDVYDSNNNRWYETPNLAQETIFTPIKNTQANNPYFIQDVDTPYLLKLLKTKRRFCTRFLDKNTLQLQFGAGSIHNVDEEITPNPDNIGIGLPFSRSKLTTAYSPVNFMFTGAYGIVPSFTTLTVRYLVGGGLKSNAEANTLTTIDNSNVTFVKNITSNELSSYISDSLICTNPISASGGTDGDTLEEIKHNSINNFQTQLRAVTKEDYLIRTLSMPPEFGSISKAYITSSKVSNSKNKEELNDLELYILSYNNNKKLTEAPYLLKENLKTYLSEYRIINDSIKIKDAYIINIGINFEITVYPNYNNNEIIFKCIEALKEYFDISKWQINQPILMKELYLLLDKIEGVQTVKEIDIINKTGSTLGYSNYSYSIIDATLNNILYPSVDPMIFEVKFPSIDIKGKVGG